ncbi:uncharacterized protein PWA37_005239 [Arxiozyma heterogenica]|uniref:Cell wall mannoprotein PIR1-like C-terminal domain-containing protein n=1 Tax=Arxiozyma heterogenica TaxID=278026 RepID=A0AAN7WNW9_9SACH|nr:hypothetical protein RI543_000174 [Kazachstania heterogenica]
MQIKNKVYALTLGSVALAAYAPSEPWTTLTPTATYKDAVTDYHTTFGIAVMPLSSSKAKRDVISQIGDGQIQATTSTVSSISSKVKTASKTTTAAVVSQIGDGQIQATTTTSSKSEFTVTAVSQIGDGQVQATTTTTASASSISTSTASNDPVDRVSCKTDGTLQLTLHKGILTDEKGRIGSIVSNRQFQFDGPPPQAGAIYAAGWSITEDGYLALGDSDIFYQCLSGNFYNLYDESIGGQCGQIRLEVVDLVSC